MDPHLIGFVHHKEQQVVLLLAACELLWPLKELPNTPENLLKTSHGGDSSGCAQQRRRAGFAWVGSCLTCIAVAQALLSKGYSQHAGDELCDSRLFNLTLGASHQDLKGVEPLQAAPGPRLIQRLQI